MNFYASWVFRCPKWIYFRVKHPEKEIVDPAIKKIGDYGERVAKKFLSKEHIVFNGRKRILEFDGFKITGKPDFKVLTPKNKFEIVEVKKVSKLRKYPMIRWIAQLNLYMAMENIQDGLILEIADYKIRKGRWKFNEKLFEKSVLFYERVNEMISVGEPETSKKENCWNCSYRHVCRA